MLTAGILPTTITAGPFRRGERWPWSALWSVPQLPAIQFADSRSGRGWQADLGLIPVTIAGLIATYRTADHGHRADATSR